MATLVTWAVVALFAGVVGLLGHGFVRFHSEKATGPDGAGGQVAPRREMVWTAIAAVLLFGLFLYAR